MTKITLTGHIIVPDSKLAQIEEALAIHIDLTRQEHGCLVFEVNQDSNDANKFNVYEEFIDQQCFAAHQVRVAESDWGVLSSSLVREYQVTGIKEPL